MSDDELDLNFNAEPNTDQLYEFVADSGPDHPHPAVLIVSRVERGLLEFQARSEGKGNEAAPWTEFEMSVEDALKLAAAIIRECRTMIDDARRGGGHDD